MITKTLIDRFTAKYEVDAKTGCWNWKGSIAGKGYGAIRAPKTRLAIYAHRLSYMYYKGEIPDGMQVCHKCDNPGCVNPDHLFIGSSSDNHLDMKSKDRHLYGERNKQHKLTEAEAESVFDMSDSGMSTYQIAAKLEICQMTAWRILNGHRWQHIYQRRHGK